MKKLVIFLDFDGVFHPYFRDNGFKAFVDLPHFENIIRRYKTSLDISLVISSSWKNRLTLDEIKVNFSSDIATMIHSVTPSLDVADGSRLEEAKLWLIQNDIECDWIALDDDHYAWSLSENLIWCLDKFQDREIELLTNRLDSVLAS